MLKLKLMLIMIAILSLISSSVVSANPNVNSDISTFEQQIGRHVLIPAWSPPKYEEVSVSLTGKSFSILHMPEAKT